MLFGKPYPATTVSFVVNEIVFDEFTARPFSTLAVCAEVRVIFICQVQVRLTKINGETSDIAIDPSTSLRDLQVILCKVFQQRFPTIKATLIVGDNVYDEFIQVPFSGAVLAVWRPQSPLHRLMTPTSMIFGIEGRG